MTQRLKKQLSTLGTVAALAVVAVPVTAQAKNGADDPVNHNAGDDNGGLVIKAPGADDPVNHDANDDKGGTVGKSKKPRAAHRRHRGRHEHARQARRGADDPANHDKGDDRGAR